MTGTDIAVVGAGMIGAAAALALAEAGYSTVLIGPDEPSDKRSHDGVFASHYDEGRITRVLDADPLWARWAAESIARYGEIEEISGIAFHHPVGSLRGVPSRGASLRRCLETAAAMDLPVETMDPGEVARRWPAVRFPDHLVALWEPPPAGYVNPRRKVAALRRAAERAGAARIADTAVALDRGRVGLASGASVSAQRVLVATGAFLHEPALLPRMPDVRPNGRTIVLFEVEGRAFRDLPCVMAGFSAEDPDRSLYSVPPVAYPDGGSWLKVGGAVEPNPLMPSAGDPAPAKAWFRGVGSEREVASVREMALAVFPDLADARWRTDVCAVAETPTRRPFIGMVPDSEIGIALGCNGYAGKSCIALGALAARMIAGGGRTGIAEAPELTPRWRD